MSTRNEENLNDNDADFESENDDFEQDVDDLQDEGAESDSASEAEHEAKDGGEEGEEAEELDEYSQDKVNARFGELTKKRREAERLAEERERENRELKQKLREQSEPKVPPMPDADALTPDEYETAVRKRDDAIRARAKWEAENQQAAQENQSYEQQKAYQKQQEVVKTANTYNSRAKKLGVKPEELQQAAATISSIGIHDDVVMDILEREEGPLITKYLGDNVNQLIEISSMSPVKAALYIERKVLPKVRKTKRKSKTPTPPSKVNGGTAQGKGDKRFPLTGDSATFE